MSRILFDLDEKVKLFPSEVDAIEKYAAGLIADYDDYHTRMGHNGSTEEMYKIRILVKPKYIRVEKIHLGSASIHSFIVRFANDVKGKRGNFYPKGTILKAASWSAPEKNFARGNIFPDAKNYLNVRYQWTGL